MLVEYKISSYVTKQKTLTLKIEILNSGQIIRLETPRNAIDYPPTQWMFDGSVNLITTGHFLKDREVRFFSPKPLIGLLPAVQLN